MKITRRQLRTLIAEATAYNEYYQDDVARAVHRRLMDIYRNPTKAHKTGSRVLIDYKSKTSSEYTAAAAALLQEIESEEGEYTGLDINDFLALIERGDLDDNIEDIMQ